MSSRGKFTEERRAIILEALMTNPSIASAAVKAGVSENTLRVWIEKGEQGAPEYQEFAQQAATARAAMKDEIVASLFKIATDELHPQATKAAHQLLTNLYPQEFSSVRHVIQHQSKGEDVDLSALPTDELRALGKTLRKLRSGGEDPKPPTPVIEVLEANTRKPSRTAN
jgi:transposase-like protein